jgi:hypothetical protein
MKGVKILQNHANLAPFCLHHKHPLPSRRHDTPAKKNYHYLKKTLIHGYI